MRLIEKAQRFDEIMQQDHTPLGLVFDILPSTDEKPLRYIDIEDAAIWTGVYVASQAFRFSVTGDSEADGNMKRSLAAIHDLQMITGRPGLMARGFLKGTDPSVFGAEGHRGAGDYEGYVWYGDVSRDQYMGVFFGLGAAYGLVQDQEIRSMIAEDIGALASHIIKNGLHIVDVDGERTRFGSFYATGLRVDGFAATLALSVVRTACHTAGDEKFTQYYDDQLIGRRGYHRSAWRFLQFSLRIVRNYVNYNLAFLALFALITAETNAELRSLYLRLLDKVWEDVEYDLNSFFTFIHHGLLERRIDDAIRRAEESLRLFPFPLVNREVENSKDPTIQKSLIRDRRGKRQSRYALPMDRRPPNNFIWKENPRLLDGGSNDGRMFSPVGYLIAYWMGRYYGYISPDE